MTTIRDLIEHCESYPEHIKKMPTITLLQALEEKNPEFYEKLEKEIERIFLA